MFSFRSSHKNTILIIEEMAKPVIAFWIILGLIILSIFIVFISKTKEGFYGNSGYNVDRNEYIKQGKQKYNELSETQDISKGNFMDSDNPAVIDSTNKLISSALSSSSIELSKDENTLLGVKPALSRATLPPANKLLNETKKCEQLRTRDSCEKLDDPKYSNCGVCIKGGSSFTYENPKAHIGGLLLLKS